MAMGSVKGSLQSQAYKEVNSSSYMSGAQSTLMMLYLLLLLGSEMRRCGAPAYTLGWLKQEDTELQNSMAILHNCLKGGLNEREARLLFE